MFRAVFNTETLRRRTEEPEEEDVDSEDDVDVKTTEAKRKIKAKPKGVVTSSAEPDRKPDVFDTHVGPFLERYVLWCQKKGVILGWIPGILGVAAFTLAALVVGGGLGYCTGQGIIWVLDLFGLKDKLKDALYELDHGSKRH